jgi:glucose-1-phosphate cytidylyltransferase
MKTIILAGGLGTRLAEETSLRPKPMIEIGGKPILWHIMNIYSAHGYRDFIIACGYKAEIIKEYFANFVLHNSDLQIDLTTGRQQIMNATTPNWQVAVVDTGVDTLTGGRIRRLQKWIGNETFMVTYGDGVANIDIKALLAFHRSHGKKATVTAVTPPPRFVLVGLS